MIQLILGRAGSGKTRYAREKLKELSEEGKKRLMLLVPEQYSFESERVLLRLLGAKQAQTVQVVSFTRLADLVFRQYGGLAGRRLNDGGRNVFMSLALEQLEERLPLYRRHTQTPELVKLMLSASAEMKMCAIPPQSIMQTAQQLADGTLKEKMTELGLILSAYEALVAQSYLDPMDDLTRLKDMLETHRFFEGYTVFIDSFKGFTVQELEVLERIFCQAEEVGVTLCTDQIDDPEQGMGLFSQVRKTARQILRLAHRNSIPVLPPVLLKPGRRFSAVGLSALEAGVFRAARTPLEESCDQVVLYAAKNAYDEARFTAMAIRRLVMEQGYHYRDFAVMVRSEENYRGCLESALERWEIPCFMDRPRSIDSEPLMRLVLSAFRVIIFGFRSDDVFAYLKTGLAGLTTEEIASIENYAFLWKISGKKWREPWLGHPSGFAGTMAEKDADRLQELNFLREKVIGPLLGFSKDTRDAGGEKISLAVFRLLERIQVPESLQHLCVTLKACGEKDLADRQARLWDLLMEILDQMALTLGDRQVSLTRYMELLRLVIASGDISAIPQGLGEVAVGIVDRMRPADPKVVFLLGASQGEFPANPVAGGIFSDEERRSLIALGMPLGDTLEQTAVEERFLAYAAMSSPSERLFVTYPCAGMDGTAKSPSVLVSEIRAALKQVRTINEYSLPQQAFAMAKNPAFELTAREWGKNSTLSATLEALFSQEPGYADRLKALERAASGAPAAFESPEKAKALFENGVALSASQIENYHLCRFQYFCRYGLNAKERKPAELNALEYGSLMHYLLETLLRDVGSRTLAALSVRELKEMILASINRYAEEKLGGVQNKSQRLAFLFNRMADSAQVVLSHIAQELCQSRFQPEAFELELKTDGAWPPLTIPLPGGGKVIIQGKIDRVDTMTENNGKYVRVVDYKTGKKEFQLGDVLYGVNMQMLIYLAALIENGKMRPAGILYMPAMRPVVPASRNVADQELEKEIDKGLRMNGLVLNDASVIRGMEEKAEGKYIPVTLKDGKPTREENIVTEPEMGKIISHIKNLAVKMAQTLYKGDIAAVPLKGDYDACAWCPYFAVCGHEKEDGDREEICRKKCETLDCMTEIAEKEGRNSHA